MNTDPDRLMTDVRKQSKAPSLPAAQLSTVVESAEKIVASDDGNRIALWLDKAHRPAREHAVDNPTDEDERRTEREPPEYLPSLYKEDVQI